MICTFNAELPTLDQALLRRGRLITKYEFRAPSIGKTNALMAELGIDHVSDKPMTLAEIFNHQDKDFTSGKMVNEKGFIKNEKTYNTK